MLAIGRRSEIFSLTNNGRIMSCAPIFVSRTRLRRAAVRRKRRGRWINFRTASRVIGRASARKFVDQLSLKSPVFLCYATTVKRACYLLIDISNSFTKLAFASQTRLFRSRRIATEDFTAAFLRRVLRERTP